MPKISIIIPVYNVEKFLNICLDSVVQQDFEDIEIICVNDCSTDNSIDILREYAQKDLRIKILNHETNKGLGPARNTGLNYATGDYVFFLDSDDYLCPGILGRLYKKALETDADAVFSKGQAYTESKEDSVIQYVNFLNKSYLNYASVDKIQVNFDNMEYMLNAICVVAWGRLYSTEFLKKNSIYFIDSGFVHEDVGFYIKFLSSMPLISLPEETGVMYRIRTDSLSAQMNKKNKKRKFSHHKAVMNDAISYIKQHKSAQDYSKFMRIIRNSNSYYKFVRPSYWFIFYTKISQFNTKIFLFTLPVYDKSVTKNGDFLTRILWIPIKNHGKKSFPISDILKKSLKVPKNNNVRYQSGINNHKLDEILKELEKFYFLPNKGNLGDGLIAASEFQYLEAKNFNYRVYQRTMPWIYQKSFNFVYGGGGIWVDLYKKDYQEILEIFKSPYLKKCVILPSSFNNCPDVIELLDERFTVFLREEKSYEYCKSLNSKAKFYLADDMAIGADFEIFKQDFRDSKTFYEFKHKNEDLFKIFKSYKHIYNKASLVIKDTKDFRVGYFLRSDKEGIMNKSDISGIDLSDFGGGCWCNSGLAFVSTKLFLAFIDRFDIIVTDRLHIAIAAAKLGKKVLALDNSYGKISSVYDYSLKNRFENVKLIKPEDIKKEINNFEGFKSVKTIPQNLPADIRDFAANYGSIKNRYHFERKYI